MFLFVNTRKVSILFWQYEITRSVQAGCVSHLHIDIILYSLG